MSERGWQEFLAADGVDDWVVLHGGATAVFRAGSLADAARLAGAIAQVAALEGSGALLTIADADLTVRLTRDLWRLEARHIELARAVSAVARQHDAVADRTAVQEIQLTISAKPDAIDLGFWRAVLGYAPRSDDNAVDPLGNGSTVWMQELNDAKPLRHAMHIDVSVARDHIEAPGGRPCCGRPHCQRLRCARLVDPGRSLRQQGLHRRVARWISDARLGQRIGSRL